MYCPSSATGLGGMHPLLVPHFHVCAMKITFLLPAVCANFKALVRVAVACCEVSETHLAVLVLTAISGGRFRSYSGPPLASAAQRSSRCLTRLGLYKKRAAAKLRMTYLDHAY